MAETLERQVKRVNEKLTILLSKINEAEAPKEQPETWVKASTLMQITGWDREDMRRARNYRNVKFKQENGFWYCLESVNPKLYKKQNLG